MPVEVPREVSELRIDQIDQIFVHLHGDDRFLVERQGRENVPAPAGAHDEDVGVGSQVVRDVGDVIAEVIDLIDISRKGSHHGGGPGIDGDAQLIDTPLLAILGAEPPAERRGGLGRIVSGSPATRWPPRASSGPRRGWRGWTRSRGWCSRAVTSSPSRCASITCGDRPGDSAADLTPLAGSTDGGQRVRH